MLRTLRCPARLPIRNARRCAASTRQHIPSRSTHTAAPTDEYGIPTQPTWSVNDLLSSYPKPTISPSKLQKLHALSALVPPEEGTPEHRKLTTEMENLVKLVEAVKLVDTTHLVAPESSASNDVPDGRIWAEGTGIDLESEAEKMESSLEGQAGHALLNHAARTSNGLYVVDSDRARR
ncbi:hypothetical protein NLI96_g5258 [Meripilus lineatus]|uniref:Glutamyl-tRNA(Gln) amidotransferase subunit F, mitochondrial n=1 Tax=Meripilus lineatus TaxID=2056292 RepID=A0AAD5V333_9APHY|nr:hypothetical protein NLI96_g5258 [Physisporinus lineatus]